MVRPVSVASGWLYRHIIKPVLFTQSPDDVHSGLLRLSRVRQRLAWTNGLVHTLWAHQDDAVLSQTIDGVVFRNPVGLSAGFDKNVELIPTMKAVGFGFMTGGSVTHKTCAGNPRPWFYRLPKSKSLVVHAGLPNDGASAVHAHIKSFPDNVYTDFPLIISVAKTNSPDTCTDTEAIEDYIGTLAELRSAQNISAFEINISCPNTYGGEPFTTPERLDALLARIDSLKLKQPVWVKMPVSLSWSAFAALLDVIVEHNVSTITIANLIKDRSNVTLRDELPDSVLGNLSGAPTKEPSNELIARTYEHYGGQLTIIGVGGVSSAEDAYQKIRLGASMVELITGMIFEGPQLIGDINQGLVTLLQQDGFSHISEAIGVEHAGETPKDARNNPRKT